MLTKQSHPEVHLVAILELFIVSPDLCPVVMELYMFRFLFFSEHLRDFSSMLAEELRWKVGIELSTGQRSCDTIKGSRTASKSTSWWDCLPTTVSEGKNVLSVLT